MKNLALMAAALLLGATLTLSDAEAARRLGGGASSGMQRQSVMPSSPTHNAAPTQAPHQQAAPAAAKQPAQATPPTQPQQPPKRSWMGPLAGLAAGIGLAALASHFGFGEQLASFMMMALLGVVVVAVIGYFMRKKAAPAQGMQYAGAGAGAGMGAGMGSGMGANYASPASTPEFTPVLGGSAAPAAANLGSGGGHVPADFDSAGFVRNAKVNFIRLQAANDAGNLDDIREFTTPEMFAEIKLAIDERKGARQTTDVAQLNAEVIDVSEEATRYIVSVRFNGLIGEDGAAPEAFDEVWHMTKPLDSSRGWVIAGIQQIQ